MKSAFLTCMLGLLLLSLGCVTTGPGGKTSLVLISTEQEVAIGQSMALEVAATEKKLADPEWQAYLNEIGQKLVAVSDRKDIQYHFTVIESDQFNAFAAPGGYVYFYTGLLKMMDNEAELAAVMAHEISHVVARHGAKRLQASLGAALAYDLVFGEEGSSQAFDAAVAIGMNLLFASYSRENEREADAYGLAYMVASGYNPSAMETMFDKLAANGSSQSSFEQLISSHPETQERINNTRQAIRNRQPLPSSLTLGQSRYQQMLKRL